jgi:hypothetical protein
MMARENDMFNKIRNLLLFFMRVPPEPEAPFCEPSSIRVFRASRKLYWLRLAGWAATQTLALLGILFWLSIVLVTERESKKAQAEMVATGRSSPELKAGQNRPLSQGFKDVAARVPPMAFVILWIAKAIGISVYLSQLAITYIVVRLDYELRWYVVTDRSLRIRSGVWVVREATMSFANLQQVTLSQGPLQRLLGISDLRVASAGGGGKSDSHDSADTHSMHTGLLCGIDNALEVRDLILTRLRQFRETGLSDPEELANVSSFAQTKSITHSKPQALEAARDVLIEVRRLRTVIEGKEKAG